ncbi:S8 family serine peptidase [Halogeometricum borinquense]|uniref:S8 family serine peptidase n=1 Tax=Halogeometricum borinquense TaxID=60847 RepID=UPI0013757C2C
MESNDFSGYILPTSNPETISVAASNRSDELTEQSNFGNSTVTVAAPGNQILSLAPDRLFEDQYSRSSGTSVAAPQVTGIVCLLRELDSELHHRSIKQLIKKGAVALLKSLVSYISSR